jgi:hypothetical protein
MEKKEDLEIKNSSALAGSSQGDTGSSSDPAAAFQEAKLFLGKDRATLTFFLEQEVASIHYDMIRDEIFYRGHNVKNMTMDPKLWLSLERFGDYLAGDPRALGLSKAYRRCLEHLRTDYGLPA